MKINLKFPAKKTTAGTKRSVVAALSYGKICSWSKHYSGALTPFRITGSKDEEIVRVYNLEKRRKVVVRSKPNKQGKKTSKVISPNHWVANYYDIPVVALKLAKLKVIQNTRNFKFVSI